MPEALPQQVEAYVTVGSDRHRLQADDPVLVPSGPVVLTLHGLDARQTVRLDGQPLPMAVDNTRGQATAAINLTRATGFHALQVSTSPPLLFGTQDAKLRIDGVVEMLRYLREHGAGAGLSWNGTLQFSGREEVLRDVRLDYAWLLKTVQEVETVARAIAARPFRYSTRVTERAREGVPNVAETARLVRRRPELMHRHPNGPVIDAAGDAWAPLELVRQRQERSTDTPGNRTATRLLVAMLELARATQNAAPKELQADLDRYVQQLGSCLRLEPFKTIRRRRGHLRTTKIPSREERSDPRYRRCRGLVRELVDDRRWDPRTQVSEEWAFAALADQVYQAFVAITLARAYDLEPVDALGGAGPHFASDHYEIWVDRVPSDDVLKNWRDDTSTPASLRPDVVIRRKIDGQVVVLDAKYRTSGSRATPDSLAEVQLYLQSFGTTAVAVAYPPVGDPATWQPHLVTNGHFNILELPIRPQQGLDAFIKEVLLPAIEPMFRVPRVTEEALREEREEAQASAVQAAAARTLVADGEVVRLTQPHAMIAPENQLRRLLADVWDSLGNDVQKMLITAEYFGDQVPDGFDHSGPVLGLFAACERLTRDRLFNPSDRALSGQYQRVTFGEAGEALRRLPYWRGGREEMLRTWAATQPGVDIDGLGRCGNAMKKVNKWRISAAHSVLVDKQTWDRSHQIVLDSTAGLLTTLCRCLPDLP